MDECDPCRRLMARMAGSLAQGSERADELTTEVAREAPRQADGAALPAGSSIGRFVLLDVLGAGGSGIVYTAYDPELERTIALKLLHGPPDADLDEKHREQSRARLVHEAKTTARLQHENVVAVHDIGAIGARVFMAMELVDGETLRRWMSGRARSWREIAAVFRQAAQGLAAAHAAGLVHRDFKPENVLIDRGGRVRVSDFGLARSLEVASAVEPPAATSPGAGSPRDAARRGGDDGPVIGTPAYMAPECLRGGAASASSDQFSFCVALHEALGGDRPFVGRSADELEREIAAGRARALPRSVPRHLRRLVGRGLAASPAARHSSMSALLPILAFDPRARRRRAAAAAVIAAAVAVAGAMVMTGDTGDDAAARMCERSGDRARAVWNDGIRRDIEVSFAATGRPYAARSAEATQVALGKYARGWAEMRTEACRATHVDGVQSSKLLDLRNACLDERLGHFAALTRLLTHADAVAVDRAVDASTSLPGLASCADVEALRSRVPPPDDVRRRASWEALRGRVAEARALYDGGRFEPALALVSDIQPAVERLGFAALTGELFQLRGTLEERLGHAERAMASLDRAAVAAEAGGDDATKARAWMQGAQVRAVMAADSAEVDRYMGQARAAVARLGGEPALEIKLEGSLGTIAIERARYPDAVAHLRRSSQLAEAALGPRHLVTLRQKLNLAAALDIMERDEEALAIVRPTLAVLEEQLGDGHPDAVQAHVTIADMLYQSGRFDEALAIYQAAARSFEAVYGPVHRHLWSIHNAIAAVYLGQDKLEPALVEFRHALGLVDQLVGRRHRSAALILSNIGGVLLRLGRTDEAVASYREALVIADQTLGPDSAMAAQAQLQLAEALMDDQPKAALRAAREAVRMFRLSEGKEHPDVGNALLTLARAQIGFRQGAEALRSAREAIAIQVATLGEKHPATAQARAWFGTTSYDLGRDRRAARAMVEAARADFAAAAAAGDVSAGNAADKAAAWLARHR